MSFVERIQEDLVRAMKAKDELRTSVLRMVKTALRNKEVEKLKALDDSEAVQLLQSLVKQRKESVEQFTQGGRADLADRESREITILESYLPAAPTEEETSQAIEAAIAATGATSVKQMGAVVKAARAQLAGKTIDGKALSDRVRTRLSGSG